MTEIKFLRRGRQLHSLTHSVSQSGKHFRSYAKIDMMSLKTTEEEEEKEEEEEEEATQMQVQQALFEKYSIFLVTHSRGFQPHEKMNQN